MRQLRRSGMGAICWLCFSSWTVNGADLPIKGLGILPLGREVSVVDGRGTSTEILMKERGRSDSYRKSISAAATEWMSAPPGAALYPQKPPYPYDSLQLYQIKTEDVRGVYFATVSVLSGSEEVFFHGARSETVSFWRDAFEGIRTRPAFLFGYESRDLAGEENEINAYVKEKTGREKAVRLLSLRPWRAYPGAEGFRWSQEGKMIVYDETGLELPLWVASSFLREGDRYYLVTVTGSHVAEGHFSQYLLYAVYGLRRGSL